MVVFAAVLLLVVASVDAVELADIALALPASTMCSSNSNSVLAANAAIAKRLGQQVP